MTTRTEKTQRKYKQSQIETVGASEQLISVYIQGRETRGRQQTNTQSSDVLGLIANKRAPRHGLSNLCETAVCCDEAPNAELKIV
jgi:hypothetical protein